MNTSQNHRPLSPHVGIYRWQLSNGLSILHRISGFVLCFGLILLVVWLWGVAYDDALFNQLQSLMNTKLGKLAMFGWTAAFFYHFGNGIRHLNWDTGRGLKLDEMAATGYLVLAFTVSMTVFTWIFVIKKVGW